MSGDSALIGDSLGIAYAERFVLDNLSLAIEHGGTTALVGPNGSGKTSLLKAMARLLKPIHGTVYLDGEAIAHLSTSAVARRLAVLPQGPNAPEGMTVRELVEQGRYPHSGPLRMLHRQDHEAIDRALRLTGMTSFMHRPVDELSGGERQRAWVAVTLAQATPILVLDEPTTFLDVGYQLDVLELIQRLNREEGMTILMALHDLNHAARYADRIVALNEGRIVADGAPRAVLTTDLLEAVFEVRANILDDPATGAPVCVPYARTDRSLP